MPTHGAANPELAAQYYWKLRDRELSKLIIQTTQAVESVRIAQSLVTGLWPTARCGQQDWEDAVTVAKAAMRSARAKRTTLRRMVHNLKDTIRIRTHLRAALPDKTAEAIEVAERMVDYMDAHGF